MHFELIKAELRIQSGSLAQIARELGVSRAALSAVVKRATTSRRIEEAIADRLNLSLHEVFPDRYSQESAE